VTADFAVGGHNLPPDFRFSLVRCLNYHSDFFPGGFHLDLGGVTARFRRELLDVARFDVFDDDDRVATFDLDDLGKISPFELVRFADLLAQDKGRANGDGNDNDGNAHGIPPRFKAPTPHLFYAGQNWPVKENPRLGNSGQELNPPVCLICLFLLVCEFSRQFPPPGAYSW
jgi:hypothetical protein